MKKNGTHHSTAAIGTATRHLLRGMAPTTAAKTEKYKNASGEVMWSVSVTGTFSYNGSSCTCTKATSSTTKPSSMWSLSNKKVSKSGNKAIASVTGHAPGVTVTRTVTLTCSPSGKLS